MIIDCHGHYTTEPQAVKDWRERQIALAAAGDFHPTRDELAVTDDQIREGIETNQLRLQKERGIDLTVFSPRASGMGHHLGSAEASVEWTSLSNDLIRRVCDLYPDRFAPAFALPQYPGVPPVNCIDEVERCVDMGFVACNLNPDPSGAMWTDPPMTDRDWWYPLYEKLVEHDIPAMIHVSGSCNPNFHHTGAHYIAADTTVFMQLILGDLFADFPTLRFVIPHGGGAVPYHWGRYRGLAQDMGKPTLDTHVMKNVFFDTCVYHQAGIDCMTRVIPHENILFASEMVGAVKGVDPETGHHYDDTKRYIDDGPHLDAAKREAIFEENVLRVYPRLRPIVDRIRAEAA